MSSEIIEVPTGHIVMIDGSKGRKLECLSIGDYGKENNIKADFLGYTKEINTVPHGKLLPLSEKWVVTLSSQYGCSMGCRFCDVHKVGPGVNCTVDDLEKQLDAALSIHPEVTYTKRLNIHYARMGEPTFNPAVIDHAVTGHFLRPHEVHPVVSTMLPKRNKDLISFLLDWCWVKNELYHGEAGLQFSINSTDDAQRSWQMNDQTLPLEVISFIGKQLPMPVGRKYALNFAITNSTVFSGERLRQLFDPRKFMVKITPMHETNSCAAQGSKLKTVDGYVSYTPYKLIEQSSIDAGFDTLVFIPSIEEDKGRITCGNAILSGSTVDV